MSELVPEPAFPDSSRLTRRAKRAVSNALKGRAGLLCVLAVLFAVSYAYIVDWREVASSLMSGRPSYPVDPALLAEARRLGLDYQAVFARPDASVGKPVLWCLVKDMSSGRFVVDGNLSWPVEISGPDMLPMSTARMGVCKPTLAVVEKSASPGVHLRFAGHP